MKNKTYDSIVAIGCSHMFGYEHVSTENNQKPSTETWVNYIGKKLNLPVYNYSMPGSSNQTILRRLYFAMESSRRQGLTPLFILQWTSLERYETYVQDAYFRCQDWPWLKTMTEVLAKSKSKPLEDWAKRFYKLFDEQTTFFESLKAIDHANLLLKSSNYKTINCLAQGWNFDELKIPQTTHYVSSTVIEKNTDYNSILEKIYIEKNFLLNTDLEKNYNVVGYISTGDKKVRYDAFLELLWKNIEKYSWWHYDHEPFTVGLKKFCTKNSLELGPERHPMESANRYVSEYAWNNNNFRKLL